MVNTTFISFTQFVELQMKGSIPTEDDMVQLKKEYRKQYQKHYHYLRKQRQKRITLRLSPQEYARIQYYARHHHLSMNKYIKQSTIAYENQELLPHDVNAIKGLNKEIVRIGNNINQIVFRTNKALKISPQEQKQLEVLNKEYVKIVNEIFELKKYIISKLKQPPISLRDGLLQFLEAEPEKKEGLIEFIQNF